MEKYSASYLEITHDGDLFINIKVIGLQPSQIFSREFSFVWNMKKKQGKEGLNSGEK